jgi:hypothetical protein
MELEIEKVVDFIPKLIDQAQNELYRFTLSDSVLLLSTLEQLHKADLISDASIT